MLSEHELYHKIIYLMPEAKFSFWQDDGREEDWKDDNCEYIKIDGWCICWLNSNISPCPSLDDLSKITDKMIEDNIEVRRKKDRNFRLSKDFGVIAAFHTTKTANPTLAFSDFADILEKTAKDIDAEITSLF